MDQTEYLKILVEDIHSTTVAAIGANGHPQTRVIDMMLWDEKGVYFLTAKGKEFYAQLMEQNYISLSAVKEKRSISLRGKIRNIHSEKLDEIFEKCPLEISIKTRIGMDYMMKAPLLKIYQNSHEGLIIHPRLQRKVTRGHPIWKLSQRRWKPCNVRCAITGILPLRSR